MHLQAAEFLPEVLLQVELFPCFCDRDFRWHRSTRNRLTTTFASLHFTSLTSLSSYTWSTAAGNSVATFLPPPQCLQWPIQNPWPSCHDSFYHASLGPPQPSLNLPSRHFLPRPRYGQISSGYSNPPLNPDQFTLLLHQPSLQPNPRPAPAARPSDPKSTPQPFPMTHLPSDIMVSMSRPLSLLGPPSPPPPYNGKTTISTR